MFLLKHLIQLTIKKKNIENKIKNIIPYSRAVTADICGWRGALLTAVIVPRFHESEGTLNLIRLSVHLSVRPSVTAFSPC